MKKKIKKVVIFIILLLSAVIIVGSVYHRIEYPTQEFSSLLYYLTNGIENSAPSAVNSVIKTCALYVIVLLAILIIPTIEDVKEKRIITIKIKGKKFQVFPLKITSNHKAIYTTIIFIISILFLIWGFRINAYIKNVLQYTEVYDKYYVDGSQINIIFPEEKRNLIFISCESMETTLCSKENGGGWDYSVIPELEKLALDNISFSNTNNLGGAHQYTGNTFTAGGLVAETAGIPLVTHPNLNESNEYKGSGKYLDNAYTLGDLLHDQGYNLKIMMGSESTFGGRAQYFKTNGEFEIFDVNTAIEKGKMREQDRVWWGFEDDKVFEWSKEDILNLASKDEPFCYMLQTADTHFVDGYLSKNAEKKYNTQYENVYAYSSKSIYEFVKWIQQQSFYSNTTIIIIGDHLGMQDDFYIDHTEDNYIRTVYNVIINSAVEEKNTKYREFSTMDIYPTIVASLGVTIEGDRLGLGTNLFSDRKTLTEELGFEYLNNELKKTSKYYNNVLLGEDYKLMKQQEIKEMQSAQEQ